MAALPVVAASQVPAPGSAPEAVNGVVAGALFEKRTGYNCVEFAVSMTAGTGDYLIYKYWQDDKSWKPEGPRGTTPSTFDTTTTTPVRISMPMTARYLVLVRVQNLAPTDELAVLEEQNR